MNLKEILDGAKDVIIESLKNGNPVEDIVESLNEKWPTHVEKLETVCEAMSALRAKELIKENEVKHAEKMKDEFDKLNKSVGDRVDAYLNESYEKFVKEYKDNLISEAKVELVNKFVGKMKETFNENSIEVDMDAKNSIDDLTKRVDELTSKLDESMNESIELKSNLRNKTYELTFESVKNEQKLSETQIAKLEDMANSMSLNESKETDKIKAKLEVLVKTLIVESDSDGDSTLNEDELGAPSNKNTDANVGNKSKKIVDPLVAEFSSVK